MSNSDKSKTTTDQDNLPDGANAAPDDQAERSDADVWAEFETEEAEKAGAGGADDDQDNSFDQDASPDDGSQPDDADADADNDDDQKSPKDQAKDAKGKDADAHGEAPATDPKELQAQIDRLSQQLSTEKGRREAEQRRMKRLERKLADAKKSQTSTGGKTTAPSDASLKAIRDDYPDFAPMADTVADLQRVIAESNKEAAETASEQLQAILDKEWDIFTKEHSDAPEIMRDRELSEVFRQWAKSDRQPVYLKEIYEANRNNIVDGVGAALLFSHFKAALAAADGQAPSTPSDQALRQSTPQRNAQSDRRQRQMAGASATASRNRPVTTNRAEPPESASEEEHWAYFERRDRELERQRRESDRYY